MMKTGKTAKEIIEIEGLTRIASEEEIGRLVVKVIAENPRAADDAITDEKAVHFLIGQLMKLSGGKVDPALANKMMREKLNIYRKEPTK